MEILDQEQHQQIPAEGRYLNIAGALLVILAALCSLYGFIYGGWQMTRVLNAPGAPDGDQLAPAVLTMLVAGWAAGFAMLAGFFCCWLAYYKYSAYLRWAWWAMVGSGTVVLALNIWPEFQWLAVGAALAVLIHALGKRELYVEN